jgi:hypothetical protein
MNKIIVTFLIIFSSLNLNQMYWDKAVAEREKKEEIITEQLLFDISEFIVDYQNKLIREGHEVDGICWTSFDRVYYKRTASYPIKLEAGITYIAFTYTTGQDVRACWSKDNSDRYSEIETGNKIIYHYTPSESGDYHYLVESAGAYEGIHVSYIIQILK